MAKTPTVRMTAGTARGAVLKLPAFGDKVVRATKNQVLQAGLNMLGSRLDWPAVTALDACCGCGQWGLEMLSRGAKQVDFVDYQTALVERNLAVIQPDVVGRGTVFGRDILKFQPTELYDVVVADPPYGQEEIYRFLLGQAWVKPRGWMMLEVAKGVDLDTPPAWETVVKKQYGLSGLWLLRYRQLATVTP